MIAQILVWALLGQQGAVPGLALDGPALFKRVAPSVVVIRVSSATAVSLGSGVVIGPGRVVTNAHVVGDATAAVLSQGARTWRTSSIWRDKTRDIALLSVDGLELPAPSIGSVSDVEVGSHVYVVGAPRGLELSLSDGLVAGLRGEGSDRLVQLTAPISPGSSGGGVFDDQGRLIGLATLVLKDSQNLNFALPIDWVVPPSVEKPSLGRVVPVSASAGTDAGAANDDGFIPDDDDLVPVGAAPVPPEVVALREGFEKILTRLQVLRAQVPKLAAFLALPHLAPRAYEGRRYRKLHAAIQREAHDLFPSSAFIDLTRLPDGAGESVLELDVEVETDAAKLRWRVDQTIKGVKKALACARDVERDGRSAWQTCAFLSGFCPERVGGAAGKLYYWRTVEAYALVKDTIGSADDLPEKDQGPWKREANSKFTSSWVTEGTSAAAQAALKEKREVEFEACRTALHFMGSFRETAILLDWEHRSPSFYFDGSGSLNAFQTMCTVPKETEATRRSVIQLAARYPQDRDLQLAVERVGEDCERGVQNTCKHVLQIRDKWALEYFGSGCSSHKATVADIRREAERLGRVGTEVQKEEHLLLADRIEACAAANAAGYRWKYESPAPPYGCREDGR